MGSGHVPRAVLELLVMQGTWRGAAVGIGVAVKLLVFLGGAVIAIIRCSEQTYQLAVKGFLATSVAYLLYEGLTPLAFVVIMRALHHDAVGLVRALRWIHWVARWDVAGRSAFLVALLTLLGVALHHRCHTDRVDLAAAVRSDLQSRVRKR
jgi:hypothetical protein